MDRQFTLDEICSLYELNKRQIRTYVQQGLVDQPYGSGHNTYYTQKHIEQLLTIHKRRQAGLSVDSPDDLTAGTGTASSLGLSRIGNVESWTHLVVDHGVELHFEASSRIGPEDAREFAREVTELYQAFRQRKKVAT